MALNPSIILSGQQFDLAGAMQNGLNMAASQKQFDTQNALAELYKTQGAGMVAGDPGAINALAQFDPQAAMGIKSEQQQMQYRAEDQQAQRETARANAEAALREQAATLDAAQVAAEAAELEATLSGAAFFYQNKDQAGYDAFLRSKGADPAEYPFQSFPAHAAEFGGVIDAMKAFAPAVPDMTSSQKDYKFYTDQETAAGRQPLSFNEWDLQSRKAGATNVTVGGGPAPEEVATFNKGVKSDNVNEVIGDIRNTISGATLPTTGMIGSALSNVGGTAAGDVLANIETLKAAASFSALTAMREASKTGAALGAVSDTEIKLLSAELANLEQSQSQEQFLRNLGRFERVYNEIVNGPGDAATDATGEATVNSDAEYDALPSGAVFVGPDGVKRRKP